MADGANTRAYEVGARSTDVFGRVLCNARDQHFVVDGPVQNGCPGEAATPGEIFLAGVGACGVELIQVFAREEGLPLGRVSVDVRGEMNLDNPARRDVRVFDSVALRFDFEGVTAEQAEHLVERFKGR